MCLCLLSYFSTLLLSLSRFRYFGHFILTFKKKFVPLPLNYTFE